MGWLFCIESAFCGNVSVADACTKGLFGTTRGFLDIFANVKIRTHTTELGHITHDSLAMIKSTSSHGSFLRSYPFFPPFICISFHSLSLFLDGLDVAEVADTTSIKNQVVGLLNAVQYLKGTQLVQSRWEGPSLKARWSHNLVASPTFYTLLRYIASQCP
jgi:hypothetical protein